MLSLLLLTAVSLADEADDVHALLDQWEGARMAADAPAVTVDEVRLALGGERVKGVEVVEGVKAAKGYGLAVYDLPVASVWKAVADESHHAGWFPVETSKVISGPYRKHDHLIWQTIDLPIVSDRWWVTRIRYNAALYGKTDGRMWELEFHDEHSNAAVMDAVDPELKANGVPIAWTKGAWMFVALGPERTFVEYHVWSDPGGSLPVGPATRFSAGAVVDALDAVEKMAREHIPKCGGAFMAPDGTALP